MTWRLAGRVLGQCIKSKTRQHPEDEDGNGDENETELAGNGRDVAKSAIAASPGAAEEAGRLVGLPNRRTSCAEAQDERLPQLRDVDIRQGCKSNYL